MHFIFSSLLIFPKNGSSISIHALYAFSHLSVMLPDRAPILRASDMTNPSNQSLYFKKFIVSFENVETEFLSNAGNIACPIITKFTFFLSSSK